MNGNVDALIDRLSALLGADHVSRDPFERLAVGRSAAPISTKIAAFVREQSPFSAVVWPGSAQEVPDAIRLCVEHRCPIVPYGGGSGICGGVDIETASVAIDTKRLCQFEVNADNAMARAGAGLFWQELEDNLQMHGWASGYFPQSGHSATVGGMVSTRGIGVLSGRIIS